MHPTLLPVLSARVYAGLLDTVQCADWLALCEALPDANVDLCLSDIPYNTTQLTWEAEIDLGAWWQQMKRIMRPGGAVVMTGSQPFTSRLVMSNPQWFRYEWIWNKHTVGGFLDANRKPLKRHENVLVFCEVAAPYYPQMAKGEPYAITRALVPASMYGSHTKPPTVNEGERYPTSIIDGFPNLQARVHPTQKSLGLFEYLIRTYTQPGALVFDPFVGSGTTALAARNTGRRFICGDLSPEYVAIARARLAEPYTPDMFAALDAPTEPPAVQRGLFDAA